MGRLGRGWELTKQSFRVVSKEKKLLLLPLAAGLILVAVLASFFLAIFLGGGLNSDDLGIGFYLFWILFYFIAFFVMTFFNVALVACALMHLDGGKPTIKYGLQVAVSRIKVIVLWAIVAATVGLVLRALSERAGLLGRIVLAFIGAAWSIATFFVVPVLAFENLGPFQAIKRSIGILKGTWGEAFVSNLGVGLIFFLLALVGLVPLVLGFILGGITGLIIAVVFVIPYWVFLAVMASAVNGVLLASLYRYATTGKTAVDYPVGTFQPAPAVQMRT